MTFGAKWHVLPAAVLAIGLATSVAGAQGKSKGKSPEKGGPNGGGTVIAATVVFRDADRITFRDYVAAHKIVPQALPPGIAKNVARGKPLPPGIAKRALPSTLLPVGAKVDKDVSLAIVGDVVVAIRAGVVIDVLGGIFK